MPSTIEKHEQGRVKYLGALWALVKEHQAKKAKSGDPVRVMVDEDDIAERACLTPGEADRYGEELKDQGLIRFVAIGPVVSLTRAGLEVVERQDEEKKLSSKVGKITSKAKSAGAWAGKRIGLWAIGLIGTIATTVVVGSAYHKAITEWLRSVFALD